MHAGETPLIGRSAHWSWRVRTFKRPCDHTVGRGTLSDMTNRDPEFGSEQDLQDVRRQVHIYEAVSIAASDAHAVLDVMLTAADPAAANHALMDRYGFSELQAWAVHRTPVPAHDGGRPNEDRTAARRTR